MFARPSLPLRKGREGGFDEEGRDERVRPVEPSPTRSRTSVTFSLSLQPFYSSQISKRRRHSGETKKILRRWCDSFLLFRPI